MTTKKQKRLTALSKRAEFEDQVRLSGLKAQKADKEERFRAEVQSWQTKHDNTHGKSNKVKACPLCSSSSIGLSNTSIEQQSDR